MSPAPFVYFLTPKLQPLMNVGRCIVNVWSSPGERHGWQFRLWGLSSQLVREYFERHNVFTVQGITREFLNGFCPMWPECYSSTYARAKVRERVRSFVRYCLEA